VKLDFLIFFSSSGIPQNVYRVFMLSKGLFFFSDTEEKKDIFFFLF